MMSWLRVAAPRVRPVDTVRARVEYCRFVGDASTVDELPWDEHDIVSRDATLDQVRAAVVDTTGRGVRTNSPATRMLFAYLARSRTRASVREIAGALGVTLSGAGRLRRQAEQWRNTDARFAETLAAVELKIRTSDGA